MGSIIQEIPSELETSPDKKTNLKSPSQPLLTIPKSKIKPKKRKGKKKKQARNLMLPIALQKFSFVNTTEQSAVDFGRTISG